MGDEGSRDAPGSDVKNLPLPLPLGKEQRRQRVGAGPGNCLHPIAEKTGGRACGEAGGSTGPARRRTSVGPALGPWNACLARHIFLGHSVPPQAATVRGAGQGGGTARLETLTPAPAPPRALPCRRPPAAAPCLFAEVCMHRLSCLFFFFPLPSQFSSVPKFTPSVTSASAPPLLGSAFCLSGSPGSMGVCDDNNPRAYITLFVLQALGRRSLMKLRAGVRPRGRSGE